ncbi:MAG: AMIN domain-containing protein [Rhodobacteraceae bacterium]|nr:AMIN domain-containing protein [Paracoccaceae bacterium]
MGRFRLIWSLAALMFAGQVAAQGLTALARVDAGGSQVVDAGRGARLELGLSQPVPFRVFTLAEPYRLVLDFSEVDWTGLDGAAFDRSDRVAGVAMGGYRPGWSRMVLQLEAPLAVAAAEMRTGGAARLVVTLEPVSPEDFAARAGAPEGTAFALPEPVPLVAPRPRQAGDRPVMVVLDPGHGGLDPGAEREGGVEAELMLIFARELREGLLRAGFEVMLTRDDDIFVPLEMRQSLARAMGADVFLSLHADALAQGRASGATIYTLSEEASDIASEMLAERHDRADLLAGVDLTHHDDEVAAVLMQLARAETAPRSDRLADALVAGLGEHIGNLHKRPRLEASFSVLKAADIPAVLIELGFMSSARDLANLKSPEWRARAAAGIREALLVWAAEDAAEAVLLRQ